MYESPSRQKIHHAYPQDMVWGLPMSPGCSWGVIGKKLAIELETNVKN
jgi:hypothetical protein